MLSEERYVSIEQARIITRVYKENEDKPTIVKRALALKAALEEMEIAVIPGELIVGNRTSGVRNGVVFPESGASWIDKEFETMPFRPQDQFQVRPEDIQEFRQEIYPYWKGRSLEDAIRSRFGPLVDEIGMVAKINQKDHAQGHICPNCEKWLSLGPGNIQRQAARLGEIGEKKDFYDSVVLAMEGSKAFMLRYAELLQGQDGEDSQEVARICESLAEHPPETFHEAVQSIWFLFVILHMESNASSFSPGRMDQYLYPYYKQDISQGRIDEEKALEIIECLWLKFNQIVYLRNANSAKYFAGFPIGFNIVIGGENELSYLFLKAQDQLLLPQPNLSVRLRENTPDEFLKESIRVVAKGSGMPQYFNDKSIIPALRGLGVSEADARNYAVVGCVEVTTPGNSLGWSDAAMFNLNKALELTLTGGVCLLTEKRLCPDFGSLLDHKTFEQLEEAFQKVIDYFLEKMIDAAAQVEQAHMDILPSPFLSSVIDDCMERGLDVTAGGAVYNFSGIQMIQIANLADSLAALKKLCYNEQRVSRGDLLYALKTNFETDESLRRMLLNKAPKYGNDVQWVDALGAKWAERFSQRIRSFKNHRGGLCHTGMYTVSAHVPMGENVGASPDGRKAKAPLADGGLSPVYGRDISGPTAVLQSVAKLKNDLTSNGGLLNMKFLPAFFENEIGIDKFAKFLRAFVNLEIPHIQFNVVRSEDLIAAQLDPERYRSMTVRVAGYTAYFTELAGELQNELIARTSYGEL
jgi:formate C-acetyltransferase